MIRILKICLKRNLELNYRNTREKGIDNMRQERTIEYFTIEKQLLYGIVQRGTGLLILLFCLFIVVLMQDATATICMGILSLYGLRLILSNRKILFR